MSRVRLNRKVFLETRQTVPDGAGGYRIRWHELGSMWADIKPLGNKHTQAGEIYRTRNQFKLIVRAAPLGSDRRPAPQQRFRAGTRIFTILAVQEHGQRTQYLSCLVQEENTG